MKVKLHPGQKQIVEDNARFKVITAGRRWGKSVISRMWILKKAAEVPGTYWIISPTYAMGKDIHWKQGFLNEIPPRLVRSKNESELEVVLVNGSRIGLRSAENPDRLRGVKLNALVIDEIASIRNWDWLWKEVLRPTLTDYEAPAMFISTPKGYNHFFELFEMGQENSDRYDKNYKSFRFTSYDNPHIPKKEIDAAKEETTEETFEQEYMAEFKTFTGLVYKSFNRLTHVVKPFPIHSSWKIYRGMDFGSNNPTVCLWVAIDPDDNMWVIDEHYETAETIDYHAGVINSRMQRRVTATYGDPTGAQWLREFAKRGLHIVKADKTTGTSKQNWILYGINMISERLKPKPGHFVDGQMHGQEGMPSLFVFNNCVNTIKEFESYRWMEKPSHVAQDKNEPDMPEKAMDHCFVGDTEILTKEGRKKIKDIKAGEFVWSPFGWNKVYRAGSTGIKKVRDYGTIECTPDHKILTTNGLKEVDKLGDGDKILLWGKQKPYSLMELITGVIHFHPEEATRFISDALVEKARMARQVFYIEMFGNTLKARFLTGIWYTILTAIQVTMTLSIWSLYLLVNTPRNIVGACGKAVRNILRRLGLLQKSGMHQMREVSGIEDMLKDNGRIKVTMTNPVKYAERFIKRPSLLGANIALEDAKRKLTEKETYNLSTKFGCYFANGVLVSNSMDALRYIVCSYKGIPVTNPPHQWGKDQWRIGKK